MKTKTLTIHTENILPIIKQWLYSDKEIFLRELVSNACDAIQKCRILSEHGELSASDDTFQIEIKIDQNSKTIHIIDNGIGMTEEEVERNIAQVAFSGAEEFLKKYQPPSDSKSSDKEQIIGHFGLGFYSAYMVAKKVTIDTLSYQEGAQPAFWECDGSSTYTITEGKRAMRGTQVTLHIDPNEEEFLQESRLRSILKHYCAFLPFPIFLNGSQINPKPPLWLKAPSDCTEKEYLEFYHTLYPGEQDPIFWIHLNVDYPFSLKGILYFPKISRRFDWNQNTIKLFCNRVFVSDHCKELIPDYLMVLRGAIDSPDIPLNVSRSTLQMDKTVRQLAQHISKKVSDRLSSLYTTDKKSFQQTWPDIELIVKLGILQDEKFYERCRDFLIWKNTEGEWTTILEAVERQKEKGKKIFYTVEEHLQSPLLAIYKEQGIEVLIASSLVDTPLISFLETKLDSIKFQRVDGAIDPSILDSAREKTLLDTDGKTESVKIAEYIHRQIGNEHLEVEAKSLSSDTLPAFLVIDEEMRRFKETMSLSQQTLPPSLGGKQTLVINTNNPLVQSIYRLKEKDPHLSKEMTQHLYDLTLLSQRALDPSAIASFVERSNRLLAHIS